MEIDPQTLQYLIGITMNSYKSLNENDTKNLIKNVILSMEFTRKQISLDIYEHLWYDRIGKEVN